MPQITPAPEACSPVSSTVPCEPVETVHAADLSADQFRRVYLRANRPVVVVNAVTEWPALRKWSPQFFGQTFGDRQVAVSYEASMPFDRFIEAVLASDERHPGPYMYRLFLHEHLPDVLPDVIPQNIYSFPGRYASPLMRPQWRRPDGYLKLLIGGAGSKFPAMHFDGDNAHAAVTEIHGDKEFILYAPEDGPFLYPNPRLPNRSLIEELNRPDFARYPLLAMATRHRAVLEPGHMVFVPSGWWHTARALTPSVSVCVNMLDRSNWQGFVDETCRSVASHSALKARLARAYLTGLGTLLTSMELLQEHLPGLARALAFPARVAPASAEWAPEPSARRIDVLVPTA